MHFERPKRAGAGWRGVFLALGGAAAAQGCLVDLDDRCGKNQHYDASSEVCVCDAELAREGGECVRCGANETGSADGCVCVEGFSRANAESACEAGAVLGEPCEIDADCGEGYDHCALEPGAEAGYCTASGCSTEADCPTDYGCNTRPSPTYCERPPQGLGTPCTSGDDCAGFEASYCETVSAQACLVNDCAPDPDKCHGDWVCCDIGLLSQSLCIPPSELEDGNCPVGGKLVPRSQ
ncbi:MAG: hypothetical protein K0R38_3362 [Polyangiaceae bacterium]|jgi:hypothetical protein|nr:hypothetical protein [Polyangiaceae bacterium]